MLVVTPVVAASSKTANVSHPRPFFPLSNCVCGAAAFFSYNLDSLNKNNSNAKRANNSFYLNTGAPSS
jgi:hypothetical protein